MFCFSCVGNSVNTDTGEYNFSPECTLGHTHTRTHAHAHAHTHTHTHTHTQRGQLTRVDQATEVTTAP